MWQAWAAMAAFFAFLAAINVTTWVLLGSFGLIDAVFTAPSVALGIVSAVKARRFWLRGDYEGGAA